MNKQVAFLVILVSLMQVLFSSSALAWDCSRWQETSATACEPSGNGFRCLAKTGEPTVCVIVTNKDPAKDVVLQYDEWHSLCGSAGGKVQSNNLVVGASKLDIVMLSPGTGITCRESFVVDCKIDGETKSCDSVVDVELKTYKGNKQQ